MASPLKRQTENTNGTRKSKCSKPNCRRASDRRGPSPSRAETNQDETAKSYQNPCSELNGKSSEPRLDASFYSYVRIIETAVLERKFRLRPKKNIPLKYDVSENNSVGNRAGVVWLQTCLQMCPRAIRFTSALNSVRTVPEAPLVLFLSIPIPLGKRTSEFHNLRLIYSGLTRSGWFSLFALSLVFFSI